MNVPDGKDIIDLAKRLAAREGVALSWIDYPVWAGVPPGAEEALKKAAGFRQWARAILAGELPPPQWLVHEDRLDGLKDEPGLDLDRMAHTIVPRHAPDPPEPDPPTSLDPAEAARLWCRAEQRRTAPKPKYREVLTLAFRLGEISFTPTQGVFYPEWASYPEQYDPVMRVAATLKKWAMAILAHKAPPPERLIREDPARWAALSPVPVQAALRGPESLSRTETCLRLRSVPLAAAYLLRAAFASPPRPARPPPGVCWAVPRRVGEGTSPPAAPSVRRRRQTTPVPLFDNQIAVYFPPAGGVLFPRMNGTRHSPVSCFFVQ